MRRQQILLGWTLGTVVLPVLCAVAFPNAIAGILTDLLMRLPYPHGTVKWALESSQGLLLHLNQVCLFLGVIGTVSTVIALIPKVRLYGLAMMLLASFWVPHYGKLSILVFGLFLYLLWLPKNRLFKSHLNLLWCPGVVLLVPALLLKMDVGFNFKNVVSVFRVFSSMILAGVWVWGDRLTHYPEVRTDVSQWPIHLLDDNITELAKSPVDVRADWHGVRVLGDSAIVSCERNPRLTAFSLVDGSVSEYPLSARWGKDNAGPLEAEVDTENSLVWTVDGGNTLQELFWNGVDWVPKRSQELPVPLSFSYIDRTEDSLLLMTVQAANYGPRRLLRVPLPELNPVRNLRLQGSEHKVPMPREFLWIPSIEKIIYAPNFGDHLFKVDVLTGFTEPWLQVPTLNGKMLWDSDKQRIIMALPNRFEYWIIDPSGPTIEKKIPTQPGVRAIALDSSRRLLIGASVLTGQVWVQNVDTGEVYQSMGRIYPMVRELAVSENRGVAVLTTWAAVYQIDYLNKH